jgi:spore maturation protein CgeB
MHYLPLAADKTRMKKPGDTPRIPVSFLGDTWSVKIAACVKNHDLPAYFLRESLRLARALVDSKPGNGLEFLRDRFPRFYSRMGSELDPKNQNGLLHLIYWRANKLYRKVCVKRLLEFKPLIAGDKYWEKILDPARFDYHPPIAYGREAFKLYSLSKVNFACSSVQMSGAVTQRVFDVPAAGGFLITDKRKQLEEMFEAGKEAVCYEDPGEVPEIVRHYLGSEGERTRIIKAARRRIAAEHTYAHRMQKLLSIAGRRL